MDNSLTSADRAGGNPDTAVSAGVPFVNPRDPARAMGLDGKPAVSRRAPIWADVPDEKWNDWRLSLIHI